MDHATYLEHHHELTNTGLTNLGLMLARGEHEDAAVLVEQLRAQVAALWEQRVADAQQGVNP